MNGTIYCDDCAASSDDTPIYVEDRLCEECLNARAAADRAWYES
jgi:hypothetical protein